MITAAVRPSGPGYDRELVVPPAPVPPARPNTWRFLRALGTDALGTFAREAYKRPVLAGRLLHHRFLLVNDPPAIRHVLVENVSNYVKPTSSIRVLEPFTGEGLLLSEGERCCARCSPMRKRGGASGCNGWCANT